MRHANFIASRFLSILVQVPVPFVLFVGHTHTLQQSTIELAGHYENALHPWQREPAGNKRMDVCYFIISPHLLNAAVEPNQSQMRASTRSEAIICANDKGIPLTGIGRIPCHPGPIITHFNCYCIPLPFVLLWRWVLAAGCSTASGS